MSPTAIALTAACVGGYLVSEGNVVGGIGVFWAGLLVAGVCSLLRLRR